MKDAVRNLLKKYNSVTTSLHGSELESNWNSLPPFSMRSAARIRFSHHKDGGANEIGAFC